MYSIVIPAYNEEKRIERVIRDCAGHLTRLGKDYELIVVSDGMDNTVNIVRKMASKNRRIKVVASGKRLGKGRAVMEGLKMCRGDMVGFMDADEPITPGEYLRLFEFLKDYDCAVASRRISGAVVSVKQPLQRRAASRAFNVLVNALFGLGIKDTQCGAKVFRRGSVMNVLGGMQLSGFEFDVELLWRLRSSGAKINEVPVVWKHKEYSKFHLRYGPRMVGNLLRLRLGL